MRGARWGPPRPLPRPRRRATHAYYERGLRRGRGAVRLRRPRRDLGQRRRDAAPRRRQADPGRRASRSAAGPARADPRPRPSASRGCMTFTLPETLWLAEQGFDDLLLAYPTTDARGAAPSWRSRRGRAPGGRPDRDGRLRRAPRPDRVGARRRRGAGPGLRSTSTPAGGRSAAGSRSGPSARRSAPPSRRSRSPREIEPPRQIELVGADGLRGPDRRRRRPAAGQRDRATPAIRWMQQPRRGARASAGPRSSPRSRRSPSSRSSTAAAPASSS